jgi:hypothetical protein
MHCHFQKWASHDWITTSVVESVTIHFKLELFINCTLHQVILRQTNWYLSGDKTSSIHERDGLIWFRIRSSGRHLLIRYWKFILHKMWKIYLPTETLSASLVPASSYVLTVKTHAVRPVKTHYWNKCWCLVITPINHVRKSNQFVFLVGWEWLEHKASSFVFNFNTSIKAATKINTYDRNSTES